MQVVWLDSAINDLCRLRDFIGEKNKIAADRAAKKIIDMATLLETNPQIGKPATNLSDYRDLAITFGAGGYILRYRIYEDTLYIVYLRHYRELGH